MNVQTAGLNALQKQMALACSCESCLGKACVKGLKGLARINGRLERPQKQMAVACSCESCLRKACGGFEGFGAGKRQA